MRIPGTAKAIAVGSGLPECAFFSCRDWNRCSDHANETPLSAGWKSIWENDPSGFIPIVGHSKTHPMHPETTLRSDLR